MILARGPYHELPDMNLARGPSHELPASSLGQDVLWHARFAKAFGERALNSCRGCWKERFTQALVLLVAWAPADARAKELVDASHVFLSSAVGYIDCSGLELNDEAALRVVSACPSLQRLNLARTQVGDETLCALGEACPDLRWLRLTETQVTGEGVQELLCSKPKLCVVC
uniref:Uncharacterized protein n=1 Tax=Calcidiscus leptoporus TaxID=127549 RepID=A0A7S0J958_9EUKA|mmetsp:Transcript_45686/g.106565  ORF Transcript_45686/g.106565 Transcript_45686/m.106565 type:complete len:171 (+) Transcript_45686:626-1138(+)